MCIEDSSIRVSHDAISLKSGWDKYGIAFGRPTSDIHISRLDLQSSLGPALAFGSEMSGGISDVHADHLVIHGSSKGIFFKTALGRGGYIRDTVISDVQMEDVDVAIAFTGDWSSHPDDHFDPAALPVISHITLKNMTGTKISVAGVLSGIAGDPFTDICLSNINFSLADTASSTSSWSCSNISGWSSPSLAWICKPHPQTLPSAPPFLASMLSQQRKCMEYRVFILLPIPRSLYNSENLSSLFLPKNSLKLGASVRRQRKRSFTIPPAGRQL
jgi:hypothetical protein